MFAVCNKQNTRKKTVRRNMHQKDIEVTSRGHRGIIASVSEAFYIGTSSVYCIIIFMQITGKTFAFFFSTPIRIRKICFFAFFFKLKCGISLWNLSHHLRKRWGRVEIKASQRNQRRRACNRHSRFQHAATSISSPTTLASPRAPTGRGEPIIYKPHRGVARPDI